MPAPADDAPAGETGTLNAQSPENRGKTLESAVDPAFKAI
jgi:hypothetical protein